MEYIFVLIGLGCLFFGGDWLVKGAIALSAKLGLPTFLISLTVIGFGTSMPELLVSVRAALADAPAIAIGNVVGSNIANIMLILGVAAILTPIAATTETSKRDISVMLGSTLLILAIFSTGSVSSIFGLMMVSTLLAYLGFAYFQDRALGVGNVDVSHGHVSTSRIAILIIAGLGLLAGGADLLVRGATIIASSLGVSDAVIGLTIVAIGTSLPELTTAIIAAFKRQSDIVISNIIGSNIFNILGILGITALIAPIPVEQRFYAIDGWVMLIVTIVLFGILWLGRGISRALGAVFIIFYTAYLITLS